MNNDYKWITGRKRLDFWVVRALLVISAASSIASLYYLAEWMMV